MVESKQLIEWDAKLPIPKFEPSNRVKIVFEFFLGLIWSAWLSISLTIDKLKIRSAWLSISWKLDQLDFRTAWLSISLTFEQLDFRSAWLSISLTFDQLDFWYVENSISCLSTLLKAEGAAMLKKNVFIRTRTTSLEKHFSF